MRRTITVEGMSCEHCEETVEEALREVEGVTAAHADRHSESATIEGAVEPTELVTAVEDAGYGGSK